MGGICFSHRRLLPPWKDASFSIIQNILHAVETEVRHSAAPCSPEGVCGTTSPSELAQQAQVRDSGSLRFGGFGKGLFPWVDSPRNVLGHPTQQGIAFSWGCQTLWLSNH